MAVTEDYISLRNNKLELFRRQRCNVMAAPCVPRAMPAANVRHLWAKYAEFWRMWETLRSL